MITIHKKATPKALLDYRKMKNASYSDMHGARLNTTDEEDVYAAVLDSLMREQGHLCAYCMRRIPEKNGKPQASIEHIVPQSLDASKSLDYRNMVAVCSGNRNATDNDKKTCDAKRGNAVISLNPLKKDTLSKISYKNNGQIFSDNDKVNNELNTILNLNCVARDFPNRRKKALGAMFKSIDRKGKSNDKEFYKTLLRQYEDGSDEKQEYVGIMIWWLKKNI